MKGGDGNGNGKPRLMSMADLCFYLGIKKSTVYCEIRKGWLPKPVLKRCNSPFWDPDQVDEWMRRDPVDRSKYNPGERLKNDRLKNLKVK